MIQPRLLFPSPPPLLLASPAVWSCGSPTTCPRPGQEEEPCMMSYFGPVCCLWPWKGGVVAECFLL